MGEGLNLLSPEAIAVYVTFLAGLAIGGLATWWRSRRGNWLVVRRKSQTPQITISDRVRENLQIQYKNTRVNQLVLNILEIENRGATIIEDVSLTLVASPAKTSPAGGSDGFFVEAEVSDPLGRTTLDLIVETGPLVNVERHGTKASDAAVINLEEKNPLVWYILLHRPYMNPRRSYKTEVVELAIFSNQEIKIAIRGGGKGWYAKLVEFQREPSRWVFIVLGVLTLGFFAVELLNPFRPATTIILALSAILFYLSYLLVLSRSH